MVKLSSLSNDEAEKARQLVKEAEHRVKMRYERLILAEDTRRTIAELELMLMEKRYRSDSELIHIEMMKLTDRYLTQTV